MRVRARRKAGRGEKGKPLPVFVDPFVTRLEDVPRAATQCLIRPGISFMELKKFRARREVRGRETPGSFGRWRDFKICLITRQHGKKDRSDEVE